MTLTKIAGIVNEHSPALLVGIGIVGFVGTVVLACKATTKMNDILDEAEAERKKIEEFDPAEHDSNREYTEDDRKKDLKIHTMKTRMKIVKNYILPFTLGVGSIVSILVGFKILRGRYLLATAAYASLEQVYTRYRDRIRSKYGDAADEFGRTGIWEEEYTIDKVVTDPETGEETTVTETVKKPTLVDPVEYGGDYFHLIGPESYLWKKCGGDTKLMLAQLSVIQNSCREKHGRKIVVNMNDDIITPIYGPKSEHHTDIGQISGRCLDDLDAEKLMKNDPIDLGCFIYNDKGDPVGLKLVRTTTMDGTEEIEVPYICPNVCQISYANINKFRNNLFQRDADQVKVRKGGKYISQGGC